jgi:cytochrome c2
VEVCEGLGIGAERETTELGETTFSSVYPPLPDNLEFWNYFEFSELVSCEARWRSSVLAGVCKAPLTCAMRGPLLLVLGAAIVVALSRLHPLSAHAQPNTSGSASFVTRSSTERKLSTDLEIAGDLAGLPEGKVRYIARLDLLSLPQVSFRVGNDPNFSAPTEVSGVSLQNLVRDLAASPANDLVVAICADDYRGYYPLAYLTEHVPVLVLSVNGLPPERWPKDPERHGLEMGPYLITHQDFKPAFKILAHQDEPQIPWGVTRLEFRNEKQVLAVIAPPASAASDPKVLQGFRIAQQNCLRCHNMNDVGGTKAGRPWPILSAWATASPDYFAAYVRNPKSKNPHAEMYPNPSYDDATLQALIAYFRTFSLQEKR